LISPRLVAKIEAEEPTLRLAVLINADNAQAAVIEGLLAEITRFGEERQPFGSTQKVFYLRAK